jgi:hypothetical protein
LSPVEIRSPGWQIQGDGLRKHKRNVSLQSIPSPKAEPFKQWLAQVGYERVQEIENPEIAQERMKELYELKGYPKRLDR